MTYSILARDPRTGQLGVAVQSHYFGVGRAVPWGEAGVGVVATQSVVNPAYGKDGLRLLADGVDPAQVLDDLRARDELTRMRQVALLDVTGASAAHTGRECVAAAGHEQLDDVSVQANLVASPEVWLAMLDAFAASDGDDLADRLLAALWAAEHAGGDIRGRMSAAMLVVAGEASGVPQHDRPVDIRVDWSDDPLGDLGSLLTKNRALDAVARIAGQPGLMRGPMTAGESEIHDALAELDAAQTVAGPANPEPTVWASLLLARAQRPAEAAATLATISRPASDIAQLVRRLAGTEVWTGGMDELESLLGRPGSE